MNPFLGKIIGIKDLKVAILFFIILEENVWIRYLEKYLEWKTRMLFTFLSNHLIIQNMGIWIHWVREKFGIDAIVDYFSRYSGSCIYIYIHIYIYIYIYNCDKIIENEGERFYYVGRK